MPIHQGHGEVTSFRGGHGILRNRGDPGTEKDTEAGLIVMKQRKPDPSQPPESSTTALMAPEDWDSMEKKIQLEQRDAEGFEGDDDASNGASSALSAEQGQWTRGKESLSVVHDQEIGVGLMMRNDDLNIRESEDDTIGNSGVSTGPEVLAVPVKSKKDKNIRRIGSKTLLLGWIMVSIGVICSTVSALAYEWTVHFTLIHALLVISHWVGSTACVVSSSVPAKASNYDMIYRDDCKRPRGTITIVRVVHGILVIVMCFSSYLYFSVPPFISGVILFLISVAFMKPQHKYSQYLKDYFGISSPWIPVVLDTVSGKLALTPILAAVIFVVSTSWNLNDRDTYLDACVINKQWLCSETYWDYTSAPSWMLILDFLVYLFGLFYILYESYCTLSECNGWDEDDPKLQMKMYAKAARLLFHNANLYVRIFSIALTFWGVTYYLHVQPQALGVSIIISGLSSFMMQALFMIFGRKKWYATTSALIIFLEKKWGDMGCAPVTEPLPSTTSTTEEDIALPVRQL